MQGVNFMRTQLYQTTFLLLGLLMNLHLARGEENSMINVSRTILCWLLLSSLSFGQGGSAIVEPTARNCIKRYEADANTQGTETVDISKVPAKVTAQKSNVYLGMFYSCMFDQIYDVEVSELGEILNFKRLHPTSISELQDKPKWSREEAVARAWSFAEAVLETLPSNIGQPTVKYESRRVFGGKFTAGVWQVSWKRVDGQGYPFMIDGLDVYLSEAKGGTYVSANFTSKFNDKRFEPIKRDEALKLALAVAGNQTNGSIVNRLFGRSAVLNQTPISDGLFVIRPNSYLVDGSTGVSFGTEARLAWGFLFSVHVEPRAVRAA